MTISTIRRYTDDDKARVRAAAERFCQRHSINPDQFSDEETAAETAIDFALWSAHPEDKARLRKLWTDCYCRALKVPYDVRTTTGNGYIGVSV
jgi:hypothetical protein